MGMKTEERFKEIYMNNYAMLRTLARRRGIPENEVDDAIQETFKRYYEHYPLEWSDTIIKMKLVKIMKNYSIDCFRKAASKKIDIYEPKCLEEILAYSARRNSKDTMDIVMDRMDLENLMMGIKSLPEEEFSVFVMYVIQGRTMKEISEKTGVSVSACRMRLMRGRRDLETYMKNRENAAYGMTKNSIFRKSAKTRLSEN